MTDNDQRDQKGRFGPGNKHGKGRPRQRPLRDVCSEEDEAELWRLHCVLALTDASAREFMLRQLAGNPYQSAPELPAIKWPRVTCLADLLGAVNAVFGAQRAGIMSAAGFGYCIDLISKLSSVFERVEFGPEIRRIKDRMAEMDSMQGAA